jgi:hypothetical protein
MPTESITITVAGVDRTEYLCQPDSGQALEYGEGLRERQTINCEFMRRSGSWKPERGQHVTLSHSVGGAIFGGYLASVRRKRKGGVNSGAVWFVCTAVSYEQICDRRRAAAFTYVNETAGDIFEHQMTNSLVGEGFTVSIDDAGPVIPKFEVQSPRPSVREIADAICERASNGDDVYYWNIDTDKVIHLFKQDTTPAPFSIADANPYVLQGEGEYAEVEETNDGKINRVFVYMGQYLRPAATESFVGDGSTRTFELDYPCGAKPSIKVNDVEVGDYIGIDGVDTGLQWYWQQESKTIRQDDGGTLLTGSDTVKVTYHGIDRLEAGPFEDAADASAEGVLQGDGTGIYEGMLTIEAPSGIGDAETVGAAELARKTRATVTFRGATYTSGLRAGQELTVNLTDLDIDLAMLVQSVTMTDQGGGVFRWSFTAIYGIAREDWKRTFLGVGSTLIGGGATAGSASRASRTITASSTQLLTDELVMCDTSGISTSTDTLSVGVNAVATAWTVASGVSIVNGTYLQIGTEKVRVAAGGGTTSLTVERGALGTTAATHAGGATITVPGALVFQLLAIASAPNVSLILRKITADINYVKVQVAGGDTFSGGGTSLILADNTPDAGTVSLRSPSPPETEWLLLAGVGATGAAGSGGGGPAPAAPELTVLAVSAAYSAYGNDYEVVLTFACTLPVADGNYSHLKAVQIIQAAGPSVFATMVTGALSPFSPDGADKIYLTAAPFLLSSLSGSSDFDFSGLAINDDGSASGSPATCSITIAPPTVTAVTASEVANSVYQDANGGLHLVLEIGLTVTSPQFPVSVTAWLDFDDGRGYIHQGVFVVASGSPTLTLGERRASSSGVTEAGHIWVPTDPSNVSWKAKVIAGRYDDATPPAGAVEDAFTVTAVPAADASTITNAFLVPDATTGDELIYGVDHLGRYHWQYNQVNWLQPTTYASPYYWFSALTVQLGYAYAGVCTVSGGTSVELTTGTASAADVGMEIHIGTARRTITGYTDATHVTIDAAVSNGAGQVCEIWRQAPVNSINGVQGTDENLAEYKGRRVTSADPVQGSATILAAWVAVPGPHPPEWDLPPAKLLDGSTNLYRTFRLRIYAWTRRAANPAGGEDVAELQLCWGHGTADHYDVTPSVQTSALDLSQTNPATSFTDTAPISGGMGTPLDISVGGALTVIDNEILIAAEGITDAYIADQAIIARTMAANAVTYANDALAANAIVDSKVAEVGLGKLIAGTVVFGGNIAMARGNGQPVVTMDNTGIFLFSNCTASGSGVTPGVGGSPTYAAAGVTSSPYVGIQAASIGVFSSATGPSVTITGTGVNIWAVNGSTSDPRAIFTASAATITNGLFVLNLTASQIKLSYNTSAITCTLNTTSLAFVNGNYSATIGASSIVLAVSGGPSATLNAAGLSFVMGNYSVAVGASQVQLLYSGGVSATLSSIGVSIVNGSYSATVGSTSIAFVVAGGPSAVMSASGLAFVNGNYSVTVGSSSILLSLVGGATMQLTSSGITLTGSIGGPQTVLSATSFVAQYNASNSVTIQSGSAVFTIAGLSTTIDSSGGVPRLITGIVAAFRYTGSGGAGVIPFDILCTTYVTANTGGITIPATCAGFFPMAINGVTYKVPYFAA